MNDEINEQKILKNFLEEYNQNNNSPISILFYGIKGSKWQCKVCKIITYGFQSFYFLHFDLEFVNKYCFKLGKRPLLTKEGKNPDIDLYECFDEYQKIIVFTGQNQMYCYFCRKTNDDFFRDILYSGPYYLIINLSRGRDELYQCNVNFPSQLNIYNYVINKEGITKYELYAVVSRLTNGHYVAYCRSRTDNQWYLYDDDLVTKCSRVEQYKEGISNILFYEAIK